MSYLMKQHNYGPNTISSYRDTFKLLLAFMTESGKITSDKSIDVVDYDVVLGFLSWLSDVRKNRMSTKNVRLAHIKSFFRYVMMTAPEYSGQCSKILGIPFGKKDKKSSRMHVYRCYKTDAGINRLLS